MNINLKGLGNYNDEYDNENLQLEYGNIYKQVFIINKDLKMGKGKIAAQVAHGEVFYMEVIRYNEEMAIRYWNWRFKNNSLMKKIVLKATEKEIKEIMLKLKNNEIWTRQIFDRGLTQVINNSFTCLVIEPLLEEKCDEFFKDLKLL